MVSKNYEIDCNKEKVARGAASENQISNRSVSTPVTNSQPLRTQCCSSFTGNVVHQGRFQYLGDRPLEITTSLKGYGSRGSSSDSIFRTENTSSDWWNGNKRGWKYFRWISIFSAVLFVLGLIIYFLMIDLHVEAPIVTNTRETFFDGRIQTDDVITLDGNVLDLAGVTYREGNHRVTPSEPVPETHQNDNSSEHDLIEIIQGPDVEISAIEDVDALLTQLHDTNNTSAETVAATEKSFAHFLYTVPALIHKVPANITQLSVLEQDTPSKQNTSDLQPKESQNRNNQNRIVLQTNIEETDEIMMTSDRDMANRFTGGHRKYQLTNAHSRMPIHPTIPSTRDNFGDSSKPENETEGSCFSTRLEMCRGILPYDLTTLPLVPGIHRVSDLDAALPYFEMILQSGCSDRSRQFMCSLLEPACQPMGNSIIPPCRKACKAVAEDCSDFMLATLDLSKVFHCDLYPDMEDPTHCVNFAKGDTCLDDEFRCSDGSCIPSRWVCDNVGDCPLSDDETNCTICSNQDFKCKRDSKCVPLKWQCDGNKDCTDGSDEFDCLQPAESISSGQPHTSPCPVGDLRCVDGRCITMQQLCDNVNDCSDGADEGNCGTTPSPQLAS